MRTWKRALAAGAAVLAGSAAVLVGGGPASAAGESLVVVFSQKTGTEPFDTGQPAAPAAPAPGRDASDTDGYVRTNDTVRYDVEIYTKGGPGTNTTFTLTLPPGLELQTDYRALCPGAGSSLTPETVPAPTLPITATSYQSLPSQVLVCNVGNQTAEATIRYPVSAKVRGEVPQATPLTTTLSVVTDEVPTAVEESASVTVSARGQLDLSKNSTSLVENNGYSYNNVPAECPTPITGAGHPGERCKLFTYPLLISAPDGGKGTSPIAGDITFTDDLSPAMLYTSPATAAAAAAANLGKYGAFISASSCGAELLYNSPAPRINASVSAQYAVRNSGTISCTQPGGPGTPVQVTVSGADTSALTCPTTLLNPAGNTIPAGRCYVVAGVIDVYVTVQTIVDLGIATTNPDVWTLGLDNKLTNFVAADISGQPIDPTGNLAFNDHKATTATVSTDGSFAKEFIGMPGDAYNTPSSIFRPGAQYYEGPPGGDTYRSGSFTALPGQKVVSMVETLSRNTDQQVDLTWQVCDTWDNTKLWLTAGNHPANAMSLTNIPSNGSAAWISGVSGQPAANVLSTLHIQYGTGAAGSGTASTCADSVSPFWADTPTDARFANDPAKAAQGIYTGVTRVRAYYVVPPATPGPFTNTGLAIAQTVADTGLPIGTVLPNWGSAKRAVGAVSESDMAEVAWPQSNYNPADHSGGAGDRLLLGSAYARITKQVKGPFDAEFGTGVPQASSGQAVTWRLNPTLNAGVPTTLTSQVVIEDCVPKSLNYLGATRTPTVTTVIGAAGMPPGATVVCAAGETYLRWNLGQVQINSPIPSIEVNTRVKPGTAEGTYTNRTQITAAGDLSAVRLRQASAQFQVLMPAGIYVDKQPLTPIAQLNPLGNANLEPLRWEVTMANVGITAAAGAPSDLDIIDVLPASGVRGSLFSGDYTLDPVTVTEGSTPTQPVTVLYTAAASPDIDPQAASNDTATGTTVWCNAITGGTVVYPTGAAGSGTGCPAGPGDVTGLRLTRPGPFLDGQFIRATVQITPTGNRAGDVYVNTDAARAVGLVNAVGPVDAPERIIAASIGDYVWNDLNRNGVQDEAEPGVPGFTVRLTGVDDLGNPVTRSTTTSPAGLYAFTGLRAGTYTVTFDPASLPAGSRFTFRNVGGGTPATDSDGDVLTGAVTYVLAAGESVLELDQGLLAMNPSIAVTKYINGDDAQTAPGVTVAAGSTMSITYRVTNTGDTVLDPVRLTDDRVAADAISCPATSLAPGESMTCTASLPAPAAGAQHVNTATVTGTPPAYPDGTRLPDVTASDVAHANTPAPPVVVPPAVLPVTPPALARTGEDSQAALRLAVASLLLGLGLVVAGRRRAVR